MPWGAAIAAGGAIIGGSMQSGATKDAARAQQEQSEAAIKEQRRQYDLSRKDFEPYREAGYGALDRLQFLLGLDAAAYGGSSKSAKKPIAPKEPTLKTSISGSGLDSIKSGSGLSAYNRDRIRWAQLSPAEQKNVSKPVLDEYMVGGKGATNKTLEKQYQKDLAQYQEDLKAYQSDLAKYKSAQTKTQAQASSDPNFGILTRRFEKKDILSDPVYKSGLEFGLNQGTGAINARALQMGGYDSGATLKALTRYANDYGSTKANESFNRWNVQNDALYNRLAGISGTGQAATGQVASAGQNMATNVGNLMTGIGNAQAAGIVGGANAWGSAANQLGGIAQNYQNQQYLKGLLGGGNSMNTPTNFAQWGGGVNDYQGLY